MDINQLELEILKYWTENDSFNKHLEKSYKENIIEKGRKRYIFYDGPPFATGLPHYGHILSGTLKDVVPRFFAMNGFFVDRTFGFDCHGLPVEYEIDKREKISRVDIVNSIGIVKYNEMCRSIVSRYTTEWRSIINRLGRWVSFDRGYMTADFEFMNEIWQVFNSLFNKNLVYRGYRVMAFSTACSTPLSNFEANQNYKETVDKSVYFTVNIKLDGEVVKPILWTTTPWSIMSNLAVAVGKNITYFLVEYEKDKYIVGKEALHLFNSKHTVIRKVKYTELLDKKYEPVFKNYEKEYGQYFCFLEGDHVTTEKGTGLVQTAPGFGEEDYNLFVKHKLIKENDNILCPIDSRGLFTETEFKGRYFLDVNDDVIEHLRKNGQLFKMEEYRHNYPFCWRSDTPLIYKLVPNWFIKVSQFRKELYKNNEKINWIPENVKLKRFGNWLKEAKDWAISRNRFWGTPINIYANVDESKYISLKNYDEMLSKMVVRCDCCEGVRVANFKPIEREFKNEMIFCKKLLTRDLHREYIDNIYIAEEGEVFRRIDEVFDCWFESGSMPYGTNHKKYQFDSYYEDFEKFNLKESDQVATGDFIAEGLDQTRGWFYTLTVISTLLRDEPAFKNVIVNGIILAEDGKKMSKRLKNYPDPLNVVEKYGADALRMYLLSSPVVEAENLRFKETGVKDIYRLVILGLHNCLNFYKESLSGLENNLSENRGYTLSEKKIDELREKLPYLEILSTDILKNATDWDLLILKDLSEFLNQMATGFSSYKLISTLPAINQFIENLSNWYIRIYRKKILAGHNHILHFILVAISKALAPIIPFFAEYMYRELNCTGSVHDQYYPHLPVIENIKGERTKEIIELIRSARVAKNLSLKRPIKELYIIGDITEEDIILDLIKSECNLLDLKLIREESNCRFKITVKPNHKTLRGNGQKIKAIMNLFKNDDLSILDAELYGMERDDQLLAIIDNLKNRSYSYNEHTIQYEDIIYTKELIGLKVKSELVPFGSENYNLLFNLEMDDKMVAMMIRREFYSTIQKLRKECGLMKSDKIGVDIQIRKLNSDFFKGTEEEFKTILMADFEMRNGVVFYDKEIEMNGCSLQVKLLK